MRDPARMTRYRVRLARTGSARLLTHLGQIEAIRRAVTASTLPGPWRTPAGAVPKSRKRRRPKLAFGPAISMGHESRAEFFDIELEEPLAPVEVGKALGEALISGFSVLGVRRIPRFFPSLDSCINVVRYAIQGADLEPGRSLLPGFLGRVEIPIRKVKKGGAVIEHVDARPLIIELAQTAPDEARLTMRFGPKRTVKPEAVVLEWLGRPARGLRYVREELFSETSSGELMEP